MMNINNQNNYTILYKKINTLLLIENVKSPVITYEG